MANKWPISEFITTWASWNCVFPEKAVQYCLPPSTFEAPAQKLEFVLRIHENLFRTSSVFKFSNGCLQSSSSVVFSANVCITIAKCTDSFTSYTNCIQSSSCCNMHTNCIQSSSCSNVVAFCSASWKRAISFELHPRPWLKWGCFFLILASDFLKVIWNFFYFFSIAIKIPHEMKFYE